MITILLRAILIGIVALAALYAYFEIRDLRECYENLLSEYRSLHKEMDEEMERRDQMMEAILIWNEIHERNSIELSNRVAALNIAGKRNDAHIQDIYTALRRRETENAKTEDCK